VAAIAVAVVVVTVGAVADVKFNVKNKHKKAVAHKGYRFLIRFVNDVLRLVASMRGKK
jgi:hypothetical protein